MLKKMMWYKKSSNSWRVVNSATDPYIMVFSSFSLISIKARETTRTKIWWKRTKGNVHPRMSQCLWQVSTIPMMMTISTRLMLILWMSFGHPFQGTTVVEISLLEANRDRTHITWHQQRRWPHWQNAKKKGRCTQTSNMWQWSNQLQVKMSPHHPKRVRWDCFWETRTRWFEWWHLANLVIWQSIICFNWRKLFRFALLRKEICVWLSSRNEEWPLQPYCCRVQLLRLCNLFASDRLGSKKRMLLKRGDNMSKIPSNIKLIDNKTLWIPFKSKLVALVLQTAVKWT